MGAVEAMVGALAAHMVGEGVVTMLAGMELG